MHATTPHAPNFLGLQVLHFTVNPNRDLLGVVEDFRSECRQRGKHRGRKSWRLWNEIGHLLASNPFAPEVTLSPGNRPARS